MLGKLPTRKSEIGAFSLLYATPFKSRSWQVRTAMSHEQVIKLMRETLAQLSIEVRVGSQHETRDMLLSAAAMAVFVLAMSWILFGLFS